MLNFASASKVGARTLLYTRFNFSRASSPSLLIPQMDRLQERMIRSVAVNEGFIETIRGLRSQLAEEKSRVLALSSICGHVRTLSTAMSSYVQVHHYSDCFSIIIKTEFLSVPCLKRE
jgi:hypothetical protein